MGARTKPNPVDCSDNLAFMVTDPNWRRAVEARFWPKVAKPSDPEACWLWTAASRTQGYGRMKLASYVSDGAHRISYALHHGRSPGNLCVCHRCDNPRCVNPDHLFLGTHKDNSDDKIAKGRARQADQTGENNGAAKLSVAQVDQIRRRIRSGENNTVIAADYGVTHQLISRIRRGKAWGEPPIHKPYASLRATPGPPAAAPPPRLILSEPTPPASAAVAPAAAPIAGRSRKAVLAAYKAARGLA